MPYPVPPPSPPPVVRLEPVKSSAPPSAESAAVSLSPPRTADSDAANSDAASQPSEAELKAASQRAAPLGTPVEVNGVSPEVPAQSVPGQSAPAQPEPAQSAQPELAQPEQLEQSVPETAAFGTTDSQQLPELEATQPTLWSQTRSSLPDLTAKGAEAASNSSLTKAGQEAGQEPQPASQPTFGQTEIGETLEQASPTAPDELPDPIPETTPPYPLKASGQTSEIGQVGAPVTSALELPDPIPETAPPYPLSPPGQTITMPGQGAAATGRGRRTPAPTTPVDQVSAGEVLDLTADRQEYDQQQQIFTAEGRAILRFRRAILKADRIQVNIPDRIAVAEGNVSLTRGQQTLEGDRFVYNFTQNSGTITGGRGIVFVPAAQRDFNSTLPSDISATAVGLQPLTERIAGNQPSFQYLGSPGGISFGLSGGLPSQASNTAGPNNVSGGLEGSINRLRFESAQVNFTGDGFTATDVRITNDPFSPPELELRSPFVTYSRLSPTESVIRARNPRIVFDQSFSLPLLVNQVVLSNRRNNTPGLLGFGYDDRDRGGFYLEREFPLIFNPIIQFSVTPQYLIQRSIDQGDFFTGSSFGLVTQLGVNISPTTAFNGVASFGSLDLTKLDQNLRATARLSQQLFGQTVALQYVYRNRVFNGSLGYQTVRRSYGIVVNSPSYTLGTSQISLSYRGSIERINAKTDVDSLLPPPAERTSGNDRVSLTRYQIGAALSRPFLLWAGTPLPPTPTQGLRYTPNVVVPYIAMTLGAQGVFGAYSNGDTQANLTGTISFSGQFGHFSKPFLDYTAFNFTYSAIALDGKSPFLFDRVADQQVISAGITQQIYGPFRFGFQIVYNPESSRQIATVYTLEYSRRTYSVLVRVSPELGSASFSLQINDFNWIGNPGSFSRIGGVTPVSGGVEQVNY